MKKNFWNFHWFQLHFIFRHKNPLTGLYEEKHAKKPSVSLNSYYTDKKPHLYTLIISPDNSFQIFIDQEEVNSGSLLEDMTWVNDVIFTLKLIFYVLKDLLSTHQKKLKTQTIKSLKTGMIEKQFLMKQLQNQMTGQLTTI